MCRSNVDDSSSACALHARQGCANGVESGTKIDRNDGAPTIHREALDRADVLDARVIHQDVDFSKTLPSLLDEIRTLLALGEVGARAVTPNSVSRPLRCCSISGA